MNNRNDFTRDYWQNVNDSIIPFDNRGLFLDNLTSFNRKLLHTTFCAWIASEFRRGDLINLLRCVYDIGPFQAKLITTVIYPCPADKRRRDYKLHAYSLQSFTLVSDKRDQSDF